MGQTYKRVSRRLTGYNTEQFPTLGVAGPYRFTVAWSDDTGQPYGQLVQGAGTAQIGSVTTPAAIAPGNATDPVPYNICGYFAVNLGDLHEFSGDNFQQYREYRIRKVTYTFTPRAALFTTLPGGGSFSSGPEGAEVMLVNTSKTGQFVMPYPMEVVAAATRKQQDYPWYQVLNFPSVRNISKLYRLQSHRVKPMSMTIDATEDFVQQETWPLQVMGPNQPSFAGFFNDVTPKDAITAYAADEAAPFAQQTLAGRFHMKRRRFRWTKQWLMWRSNSAVDRPQYVYVRNDGKPAHGLQFMIKARTYWRSTLPYFNMAITAQVEFRGQLLQRLSADVAPSSSVLFPWTNATFQTTM